VSIVACDVPTFFQLKSDNGPFYRGACNNFRCEQDKRRAMFGGYWQYQLPLWILMFVFLLFLLVPMEVGFRFGAQQRKMHPDRAVEARGDVTLTAMLALLGLVLAFTYSFTMSRADLRKMAVITEVNSLSTAFLRADLLPEPGRTNVRERLFEYAQSRYVEPGTVRTPAELEEVVDRSLEAQSKIWPAVKAALRQKGDVTDPERALLVSAVNDVLDSHISKMAAVYDRLPTAVLAFLVFIGGASLGVAGYNSGLQSYFRRWRLIAFAMILAFLIYIILDFDMMLRGFIQADQNSLVSMIKEMQMALQP